MGGFGFAGRAVRGRLAGRVVLAASFTSLVAAAFFVIPLSSSPAAAQSAVAYTYDQLGRVAVADYGNSIKVTHTYDAVGNCIYQCSI
jgi:hypothetical protein